MSRSRLNLLMPLFAGGVAAVCVLVGNCAADESAPAPKQATSTSSIASPVASMGSEAAVPMPLLDGLRAGETIDGWTVSRMVVNESVEKKPQLAVELERRGSGITVWIARKENAKNPPLTTAKYALSFGHFRPYGEPISEDMQKQAMNLLAERVRRSETSAEPPPGL